MSNKKYACEFCGTEIGWEETDDVHGEIWGCESCGKAFCSKCFQDIVGDDEYWNMMRNDDIIRCPECYQKLHKERIEDNDD